MTSQSLPKAVEFSGSVPILRVRNLEASVSHYSNVLGFTVDWQEPGIIASVSRGRASLMLAEGDQGNYGGWVWIGVADAGALRDELRASGANIRVEPTNFPWAYEMQVSDPDGNVLRFGSEPKKDRPFGAWRDMRDERWVLTPHAGWKRVPDGW